MSDLEDLDCSDRKTIADLLQVMSRLRTPVTGCPWDLEQDFHSIAPYTIEEAYEVADAIARGDMADLKDELGDLLLQTVYHARMAEEIEAFDFADVVDGITRKMIRRHPHVFGDEETRANVELKGLWQRVKAEEKRIRDVERGVAAPSPSPSVLDDVPVGLPALTRAVKLQHKAAGVGFDWPDLGPVLAKAREELTELEEAVQTKDPTRISDELGDVMFVLANVARHMAFDPETALRGTNEKFVRRFRRVEELLADRGKTASQSDLDEMDQLWDQAKAEERADENG